MLSTVVLSPLAAVCQPAAKLPLLGHLQAARAIRLRCNELVPLPTQLEIFYFTISFSNPRPFLLLSWLFLLLVLSSGFCFPFFLVVFDVNNVPVDVVAIFLSFTFFTYLLFLLIFSLSSSLPFSVSIFFFLTIFYSCLPSAPHPSSFLIVRFRELRSPFCR